jgi:cytosine/uracil/thiamine/allantoin permease
LNFVLAIGIGSLVIFFLMNLVGYAGVRMGVPYPVLARASFGVAIAGAAYCLLSQRATSTVAQKA